MILRHLFPSNRRRPTHAAVDLRARHVDETWHLCLPRRREQPQGSGGVDFVILLRRMDRVANAETGEMVDRSRYSEVRHQRVVISNVDDQERDMTRENIGHVLASAVHQVVHDDDTLAARGKLPDQLRSDETGATRHDYSRSIYCHDTTLLCRASARRILDIMIRIGAAARGTAASPMQSTAHAGQRGRSRTAPAARRIRPTTSRRSPGTGRLRDSVLERN